MALPARSTGFTADPTAPSLPDVPLWVCEDTNCAGQVRARTSPVLCPEKGCDKEVLLAPMSRQHA